MIEAPVDTATDARETDADTGSTPPAPLPPHPRTPLRQSWRRFTIAVCLGAALVSLPYLRVLWDPWIGMMTGLRSVQPDNFYELQARGIFAGHLWVPKDSLGIEGFPHEGHT